MNVWHLITREALHRRGSFALGTFAVLVAVGCLLAQVMLLDAHDARTRQILARKQARTRERMAEMEEGIRQAMRKLGLNIVILPRDQNLADWYADDYASKLMPADYVHRLARAKVVTVRHFVPQLRRKVQWPETKWTVILVGTAGKAPDLSHETAAPLVQSRLQTPYVAFGDLSVPAGSIVLGSEVHRGLGLAVGRKVRLFGREFTVSKCRGETGTPDDVTVWIDLRQAQEMLDCKDRISEILALECRTAWANLPKVREEIARVLPDTQVIERASEALALAETRTKAAVRAAGLIERERQGRLQSRSRRKRLAVILISLVMAACAVWIALLASRNVRDRRTEIALLRALGLRSGQIVVLFLSRSVVMGLIGGVLGSLVGLLWGRRVWHSMVEGAAGVAGPASESLALLGVGLLAAVALVAAAGGIPAVLAARQDPAVILREE